MKYYNIRVIEANKESEVVEKILNSDFVDNDNLSDVILPSEQIAYFPNGFDDWQETHFEIVKFITERVDYVLDIFCSDTGTGGLYQLAKDLTNKFELLNKDKEWGVDEDTQYHDHLEVFLKEKLK